MLFQMKQFKNFKGIKKIKNIKNVGIKAALIAVGVVVGVTATFLYIQRFGIPFTNILQDAVVAQETRAIEGTIKKVKKLIVIPEDEQPVLATIVDVDELVKREPFYAGAQNGDIVLMFQKNLKAIIYSPERNVIVNVGPIYVPDQTQTGATTTTVEEESEQVEDLSTE